MLYKCDPEKNTVCAKTACGVECFMTTDEKYAKEDSCTLFVDGQVISTTDFAIVIAEENGNTILHYNTDVVTLGLGVKMMAKAFQEHIDDCDTELRNEVYAILANKYLIWDDKHE